MLTIIHGKETNIRYIHVLRLKYSSSEFMLVQCHFPVIGGRRDLTERLIQL